MTSLGETIVAEDVADILRRRGAMWSHFRGGHVFLTGGTGFFGRWLLETLLAANREFSLNCRVLGLSRDPDRFAAKAPHLARDPAVT